MTDIIFSSRTGLNYKRGTPEQGIVCVCDRGHTSLLFCRSLGDILLNTYTTNPSPPSFCFGVNILKAKTDTDILARNSSFQKLVPGSLENRKKNLDKMRPLFKFEYL